jgi:hypothetical protein
MTLPVLQKSWTISPNNRIAFVSLNDTMGNYHKGMADFLLAHGYTCKGSCNGTTGAMDGVNRWTTVANASVRAANTTTAVSWMVLTDGNGCNILLSYVGATDDVTRISFSPSGVYVAAGTPSHTPTATDEQILLTGVTVIGTATTLDRLWYGWVDSTSKLCRFIILRDSAVIGPAWGVELLSSRVTIAFSPAVWGFAFNPASFTPTAFINTFSANVRGGKTRINAVSVDLGGAAECFLGATTTFQALKPELQAGIGFPMFPLSVGSTTATRQGPVGDLYDWATGPGSTLNGNVFFGGTWVVFGPAASIAWPWDAVTQPLIA